MKTFGVLLQLSILIGGTSYAQNHEENLNRTVVRGVVEGGAQTQTQWVAYPNAGKAQYYSPVEFFKGLPSEFPEMELIHSGNYPELKSMAHYLESVGVPVMVGNEGELDSFFDLYLPTIARSPTLDGVPLGPNKNAGAGKLYLLHHDFAHHFAGIPGIRSGDLRDREATRKLIIDIVLWKEVFATAQSSSWYLPKYWEWRENPDNSKLVDFRRYAQGYYTGLSPMTPSEHVDLVQHFVFGETQKYISLLSKKLTPASLQATRSLSVPRVIPDLAPWLGSKIDANLMGYFIRVAEPIHSYFRPVGHLKFVKYCEDYADMLMQDWYVKWSEDFQVGVPLQELHERTLNLIEQTRSGRPLVNPQVGSPAAFKSWEFSLLKTEVTLLGRKFREVIHASPRAEDRAFLESEYDRVVRLFRELDSESEFSVARSRFLNLIAHLEENVNIEKLVPWSARSRDASYKNFWRNPYAVIWKRGDALNNANAAHLSTKRLQHVLEQGDKFEPKRRIENLQKELLDDYRQEQQTKATTKRGSVAPSGSLSEHHRYVRTLQAWIQKSLKPQFPYFRTDTAVLSAIESELNEWTKFFETSQPGVKTYQIGEAFAQATYDLVQASRTSQANRVAQGYLEQLRALRTGNASTGSIGIYLYTSPPVGSGYVPGHIAQITSPEFGVVQKAKHSIPVQLAPPTKFNSVADWISTQKIVSCNEVLTARRPE